MYRCTTLMDAHNRPSVAILMPGPLQEDNVWNFQNSCSATKTARASCPTHRRRHTFGHLTSTGAGASPHLASTPALKPHGTPWTISKAEDNIPAIRYGQHLPRGPAYMLQPPAQLRPMVDVRRHPRTPDRKTHPKQPKMKPMKKTRSIRL